MNVQIAVDYEASAGGTADLARNRVAQPVPVEKGDDQNDQHDKREKNSGYPFERTRQCHSGVGGDADNFCWGRIEQQVAARDDVEFKSRRDREANRIFIG